jgi:hypothetical protein
LHGSGTEEPVAGKTPRLSAELVELIFVGANALVMNGMNRDTDTPSRLTRTKRTEVNAEIGSTEIPLASR